VASLEKRADEDVNTYVARLQRMCANGDLAAQDYFGCCERELSRLYLSMDNPRAQSGHGGDVTWWRHVRWMILEAVVGDGTFIDVGCANGHLIESLDRWMRNTDVHIAFYGLEISPALYDLAQRRLPDFAPRIFLGNAMDWRPPFHFDYVYTMLLPDIPDCLRKPFLDNLWDHYVKPGGRLILGPWNDRAADEELSALGFHPSGYCEKTVPGRAGRMKRIVWIDRERQATEE